MVDQYMDYIVGYEDMNEANYIIRLCTGMMAFYVSAAIAFYFSCNHGFS